MATMKLVIEKFDRSVNFGLWQVKMKAILIQNGALKALDGEEKKHECISEARWEEMDAKALSAIQLCLSNEVSREVVKEETSKLKKHLGKVGITLYGKECYQSTFIKDSFV